VKKFTDLIARFSDVKILVVGDVMLDRYWRGSVERISPEAPVPVVRLEKTSLSAGGAANVAANIAGLGATPFLVGAIGDDYEGKALAEILQKQGICSDFLVTAAEKPTIVKTRIVAQSQHVVRIDQEEIAFPNKEHEENICALIEKLFDEIDLVLISDYAKGLLTENILARLITSGRGRNKKVLIDPKGKNFSKYRNASMLTPNKREAMEAVGHRAVNEDELDEIGFELMEMLDLESLLITKGEQGMSLFQRGIEPFHLNSLARKVFDVTGAGDTVISTLAVALGASADLPSAAEISNIAAGLVVEEIGTTVITREKLTEHLQQFS
jgi:rfaE bifunctional protein kinase chain/domain